jgi:hypothetical protein
LKTQPSSSAIAPRLQQNDDRSAGELFILFGVAFTVLLEALTVAANFKNASGSPSVENVV